METKACWNCRYEIHSEGACAFCERYSHWIAKQAVSLITKAFQFGSEKHKNQKDDSGKNYFDAHCVQVFNLLGEITSDVDVLCAGLLHDTIEDTQTTYEELCTEFNKRIADLVMEVTQEGTNDNYGYYFPRLKSKDGILIKLCDRASNISRMESWDIGSQKHYLKKTKFWKSAPPPINLIKDREMGVTKTKGDFK